MRDGQISVLVIEDEADIRQLLRTLLEREGYTVSEAIEGRDGVRQFHQSHPDIVILDVGLPDLDGWQVLERIRDMSDVPVLMLTALGTERDKVRGLNAGADDYLTKPFSRVSCSPASQRSAAARCPGATRSRPSTTAPCTSTSPTRRSRSTASRSSSPRPSTACWRPWRATRARSSPPDQLIELAWDDPSGLAPSRVKYAVLRLRRKLGWDDGDDAHRDGAGLRLPVPLPEPVSGPPRVPDRPPRASRSADARNRPTHRLLGVDAGAAARLRPGCGGHRPDRGHPVPPRRPPGDLGGRRHLLPPGRRRLPRCPGRNCPTGPG